MPDHHRLPLARDLRAAASEAMSAEDSVRSLDDARGRRDLMQIGDLARETGKTVRAIHLYEELGLLTPAARSKGRFRLYGPEALLRIRWIGKLQEMGFSLGDIQTVVHEWEHVNSASGAMKRMRDVYARKLAETQAQRRRLEVLERELEGSLAYLDACDVCDPQRLLSACRRCDLHDKETDVPELVLGFRAQSADCASAGSEARQAPTADSTNPSPKPTP
jgi:DNA-binding transcriptional MerR regulator